MKGIVREINPWGRPDNHGNVYHDIKIELDDGTIFEGVYNIKPTKMRFKLSEECEFTYEQKTWKKSGKEYNKIRFESADNDTTAAQDWASERKNKPKGMNDPAVIRSKAMAYCLQASINFLQNVSEEEDEDGNVGVEKVSDGHVVSLANLMHKWIYLNPDEKSDQIWNRINAIVEASRCKVFPNIQLEDFADLKALAEVFYKMIK